MWCCAPVWYEERAESSDVQLPTEEQRDRPGGDVETTAQALARQRRRRSHRRGQHRRGRPYRGRRRRPGHGMEHRSGHQGRRTVRRRPGDGPRRRLGKGPRRRLGEGPRRRLGQPARTPRPREEARKGGALQDRQADPGDHLRQQQPGWRTQAGQRLHLHADPFRRLRQRPAGDRGTDQAHRPQHQDCPGQPGRVLPDPQRRSRRTAEGRGPVHQGRQDPGSRAGREHARGSVGALLKLGRGG